jgi:hypothetical protein
MMFKLALPLLFLGISLSAQTNATFTFNASATYTASGSSYAILATGTGTLSGAGTAQLLATTTLSTIAGIAANSPITTSVTMIFSNGDVLLGQLVIPAGYVVPQLGQVISAVATFTVTGGGGSFAGASGLFSNITVSAAVNGTAMVQGSGNGTIWTPALHTVGTPSYSGSFAHFASGVGWETIITLVNKGITNAQAEVNFYDESGIPRPCPWTFRKALRPPPPRAIRNSSNPAQWRLSKAREARRSALDRRNFSPTAR